MNMTKLNGQVKFIYGQVEF